MIEDRIQILRRAAKVSSKEKDADVWCVIAGNDKLLDDIAYNAITAKDRTKILFRETITIEEKHTVKKFDCIMLRGETLKIRELCNASNERGGASIQITQELLKTEPNALILVGPEDAIKKFVGETGRKNIKIEILIEDHTTGFIKSEIKSNLKIPSFLKNTFTPILGVSDVVLSTILISVKKEEYIKDIRSISKKNKLFGIDLKNTIKTTNKKVNETAKKEVTEKESAKKEVTEKESAKKEVAEK